MSNFVVDGLLQLFVHRYDCSIYSKAVFGEVGGVGGGESGGIVDEVAPAEFWSTELVPPSVVDSSSSYSGLLWISTVDGPGNGTNVVIS